MAAPLDPHPLLQDYAHPEKVVTSQWLGAKLGTPDVRVVESDEDSLLYDLGHIPTAIRIDWRRDLSDPITRNVISPEAFAQLMREKGIRREDTVVIYGDHSNWWAAFAFWVFTLYGHPDVRLLNGGRDAWIRAERETTFAVPESPESTYPVPEVSTTGLISVDDLRPYSRRGEHSVGFNGVSEQQFPQYGRIARDFRCAGFLEPDGDLLRDR